MNELAWAAGLGLTLPSAAAWMACRQRNLHLWMPAYLRSRLASSSVDAEQPCHVFLSVCDHYEPEWGAPSLDDAVQRVDQWCEKYPQLFSEFEDSLGRPPQHSFFFPQDQYQPEYLDRLAVLCGDGFGDVDVHLHHDHDTEQGLTDKMSGFRDTLFERHGLLRRCPDSGEVVYGFIHGNWALCNSRPDGRWCGVDNEIDVLRRTGCYADFTMPSAPSKTQTRTVNSIYYARQQDGPKSHDQGLRAVVGSPAPEDGLLMVQGPLCPDWKNRKLGIMPRIENADVHSTMPATSRRMKLWLDCHVHVEGQPNWIFVKLHTHGCKPGNLETFLGDPMVQFHEALRRFFENRPDLNLHYVTAWETARLVHAAESGASDPADVLSRIRNPQAVNVQMPNAEDTTTTSERQCISSN